MLRETFQPITSYSERRSKPCWTSHRPFKAICAARVSNGGAISQSLITQRGVKVDRSRKLFAPKYTTINLLLNARSKATHWAIRFKRIPSEITERFLKEGAADPMELRLRKIVETRFEIYCLNKEAAGTEFGLLQLPTDLIRTSADLILTLLAPHGGEYRTKSRRFDQLPTPNHRSMKLFLAIGAFQDFQIVFKQR